jgi:dienelactone hydrolase
VSFRDLGDYSDWVGFARAQAARAHNDGSGLTAAEVRGILAFGGDTAPIEPRVEGTWLRDGIAGEAISWSVGYGPRTQAWLLRPASGTGPLPGVIALHDHSAFKLLGKEKIADGPDGADPCVSELRRLEYEGLAFANRLALRGFAVLVPDVFLWGSRRFADDVVSPRARAAPTPGWLAPDPAETVDSADVAAYNRAARSHEHVVEKYCRLLGTTLAAVVAYEDRVAGRYLASRGDVLPGGVGCIGLSGGGCRAALLQATSDDIAIAIVVAMMSTYGDLLDRHVAPHTWMFFPPGLAGRADWPDLAACRAPVPLVVQYVLGDELFPVGGMRAAHERIAGVYRAAGDEGRYTGEFYEGRHWFSRTMQDAAFGHLERWAARYSSSGR